jgi:hypothetical protein
MRMAMATQAVLLENQDAWKNHVAFGRGVEELNALLLHADQAMQRPFARAGAKEFKAEATALLGAIVQEIADATGACAVKEGNTELVKRVAYGRWKVKTGAPALVHARCEDILAAATEFQDALKDYGVTPARLELLRQRIDAYQAAHPKPRQQQAGNAAAAKAVADDLKGLSRLLRLLLDKLVGQFQEANPHFVAAYKIARRILNRPGSLETKTPAGGEPTKTAPPSAPLPEPEVRQAA